MVIRWKEGSLSSYINTGFDPQVEENEMASVDIRFDSHKAESYRFSKSTDGKALFWGDPQKAVSRMTASEKLVFRFVPFNSSPATTSFNLVGLRKAIRKIEIASGLWLGGE